MIAGIEIGGIQVEGAVVRVDAAGLRVRFRRLAGDVDGRIEWAAADGVAR